jgi:hypothetical protein
MLIKISSFGTANVHMELEVLFSNWAQRLLNLKKVVKTRIASLKIQRTRLRLALEKPSKTF